MRQERTLYINKRFTITRWYINYKYLLANKRKPKYIELKIDETEERQNYNSSQRPLYQTVNNG